MTLKIDVEYDLSDSILVMHCLPAIFNQITKDGMGSGAWYFLELSTEVETKAGNAWLTFDGQAYLLDLKVNQDTFEVLLFWSFSGNNLPIIMKEWEDGLVAQINLPPQILEVIDEVY